MGTSNSCKTAAVLNLLGKGGAREQDMKVVPAERPRDMETITRDVLNAKLQVGEGLFTIGQGMIEAKAQLSHGEWLRWLTETVEFSEDTAQNYMKLVRKYSNAEALRYLGYTKALALLSLPDETRDEFIEATHMVDGEEKTVAEMTTRELKAALKERDAALKAAEQAEADRRTADEAREKLSRDMKLANERIAGLNAEVEEHSARAREAQDAAARLEKELEELRSRPVDVAVETDTAAVEAARKEAEAAMQAKLDKAKKEQTRAENARKEVELDLENARAALKKAVAEKDALMLQAKKKAAVSANEDLVLFRTLFDQAQEQINKLGGVLMKFRNKDAETAGKLQNALLALSDAVRRVAEG